MWASCFFHGFHMIGKLRLLRRELLGGMPRLLQQVFGDSLDHSIQVIDLVIGFPWLGVTPLIRAWLGVFAITGNVAKSADLFRRTIKYGFLLFFPCLRSWRLRSRAVLFRALALPLGL